MPLGFGFGLGVRGRGGGAGGGGSVALAAEPAKRGALLSANAINGIFQSWDNDPPTADRVGYYALGAPGSALLPRAFGDIFTFSRASKAWDLDAYGLWSEHAVNGVRQGYGTTAPAGWLLEGASTSAIRNPRGEGATPGILGSGGVAPTFWSVASAANITTREVVGVGVENGIPYCDIRMVGSGTGAFEIQADTSNAAAANGQAWTGSAYLKLVAGSLGGFVTRLVLYEFPAAANTNAIVDPIGATLQRYSVTRTLNQAGTSGAQTRLNFTPPAGAWEFILRVGGYQTEQNYYASSLILPPVGAPAAASRATDALSVTGAAFDAIWPQQDLRTNTLPNSESFNTGWTVQNVTVSANSAGTTDPLGGNTADLIVPTAVNGTPKIFRGAGAAVAGQPVTLAVYAKAGGYSWLRVGFGFAAGGPFAFFNVSTGAIGVASGSLPNITALPNGWYRCAVTFTPSASGSLGPDLYITPADNSFAAWTPDGASGIYLWGGQQEVAPAAPAPNLLTFPEAFDNAAWQLFQGATVAANTAAAPDFTTTADTITFGAAATSEVFTGFSQAAGTYAVSVYAKSAAAKKFRLKITHSSGNIYSSDLVTTAAWQWFSVPIVNPAVGVNVSIANEAAGGVGSVDVWGALIVQGATAPAYVPLSALVSPYIATTAAAASKFVGTAKEGWVIVDALIPALNPGANAHLFAVCDGTNSNRYNILVGGSGVLSGFNSGPVGMGGSQSGSAGTVVAGTAFRTGLAWSNGVMRICKDGGTVVLSTNGAHPVGLDRIFLGGPSSSVSLNGRIFGLWSGANGGAISDAAFQAACTLAADPVAVLA